MTENVSAIEAACVLAVVVAVAFVVAMWMRGRSAVAKLPPYRDVEQRHTQLDGSELITLTCGHRLRLIHTRRISFPCEDCREGIERQ